MSYVNETPIENVVAQLIDEPLTHLMLGHRELFHSNLLAWFFRCMPTAADQIFGSLTTESPLRSTSLREVQREKNNLDLLFRWPDRHPLVIENKVFSLPDEDQLISYAGKAAAHGESPALWLLSLSDPGWQDGRKMLGGSEWRWLSYKELSRRIHCSLPTDDSSYSAQTMSHYALVVDLLSDLVQKIIVHDSGETVDLTNNAKNALGDDRLTSSMFKLRARSVAQRVSQALSTAGIMNSTVSSALTNAQTLIEWFCESDRAPNARFGWQLQGNQFRLALITPHLAGRTAADRQARFDFAKANEDLFDFSYLDEILRTEGSATKPMPKPSNPLGFNRYDPDFVYRYKLTPDITIAQLETAAISVAHKVRYGLDFG
jgi:hypothetical protein